MDGFINAMIFIINHQIYVIQFFLVLVFIENVFNGKIFLKVLSEPSKEELETGEKDLILSGTFTFIYFIVNFVFFCTDGSCQNKFLFLSMGDSLVSICIDF